MKTVKGSPTQSNIENAVSKGLVNQVNDNVLYLTMSCFLQSWFKDIKGAIVETYVINSIVPCKDGFSITRHNCTTLTLSDGSHIRIAPTYNNNVDITRIINVSGTKGLGTYMMKSIIAAYLAAIAKTGIDGTLVLECTGVVGAGKNRREMPITEQARFFRKFGFRKFGKYDPNHLHFRLERNEDFENTLKSMNSI